MVVLEALPREPLSKGGRKLLRRRGRLPAVIYGNGKSLGVISVDQISFVKQIIGSKHPFFDIKLAEDVYSVLVRDIQRDPVKNEILHVDFMTVSKDRMVESEVPIKWQGVSRGVRQGGVLQTLVRTLLVSCFPQDMPAEIVVDVTPLGIGDSVLAGDLQMPKGVSLASDVSVVVVSVLPPQRGGSKEVVDDSAGGVIGEQSGDSLRS